MNLFQYIKGKRKGLEANRIEKEALRDTFLFEALEGYESIDANHIENIRNLQKRVQKKASNSNPLRQVLRVAAIVTILLFGAAGYLLIENQHKLHSMKSLSANNSEMTSGMINVFVPQDFYLEHKTTIKKRNYISKQEMAKIDLPQLELHEKHFDKPSGEDIEKISEKVNNKTIIEVYVPNIDYSKNEIEIAKGNFRSKIIVDRETSSTIDIFIPKNEYEKIR